jgi:ubiquinone/menaquinone biosynthesis C-methylase UbiE
MSTDDLPDEAYFASRIVPFNEGAKGRAELDEVARRLSNLDSSSLILDLGCGPGRNTLRLEREHALRVVGADRAAPGLAMARLAGAARLVQLDAARLPFRSAALAAVVMMHVLGHVDHPGTTLAEVRRVLEPGGRLVLTTPNRAYVDVYRVFNERGLLPYRRDPSVRRYFDADALREALELAGLTASVEAFGEAPSLSPELIERGLLDEGTRLGDPARRERLIAVATRV